MAKTLGGLAEVLHQRILRSWRTTLIGVLIAACGAVIDYYIDSPDKTVSAVAGVLGTLLVLVRESAVKHGIPLEPPKGFARVLVLVYLAVASALCLSCATLSGARASACIETGKYVVIGGQRCTGLCVELGPVVSVQLQCTPLITEGRRVTARGTSFDGLRLNLDAAKSLDLVE
jgi:hypothetical protein